MMPSSRERSLIVVYGSYGIGVNEISCKQKLREIVLKGDDDPRLSDFQKGIVEDLPDHTSPPPLDSSEFAGWVLDKSNHYLLSSDFNAFFILKDCNNSTVFGEAEFALEQGRGETSIIFLEMARGGNENTTDSLYNQERWNRKFDDVPVEYIEYGDFESVWAMIIGKLKSI